MLTGTIDDWLDLEKFLKRRKITYSSIMSKYYRNLLAVAWLTDRFRKGKRIDQSLEDVMENMDVLLGESKELRNLFENINMVLDANLPESEVLSLLGWYERRREVREQRYTASLAGRLRRVVQKLLGLSYEEIAPFQVSVTGEGTFITLVWDILISSELSQQDKNWLVEIAPKRGLTVEESLRFMKYFNKNRPLRSVLRK
jgi:hypothetical protein